MPALVVLGLVFSIPRQEISFGKRLRNDLFCVEWGIKSQLNQSVWCQPVCLSQLPADAADLLLWARRAGDIDCRAATVHSSMAVSSIGEQCHIYRPVLFHMCGWL